MKLMHDHFGPLATSPATLQDRSSQTGALLETSAGAPQASATVDPGGFRLDLRRSLQLHRRLALGIATAGLLGAILYFFSLWPVYTAQCRVYVQPAPPRVMDPGYNQHWPFDTNTYESYVAQQMVSVTRRDVLADALHKLGPGWQRHSESEQAAIERLGRAVEVSRLGTSYEIVIMAHASRSDLAAQMANAISTSYVDLASKDFRSGDASRLSMLREEDTRLQNELAADRAEQQELNKKLGVASVSASAPDLYDEDQSRIREELIKARTASDEAAARLRSMDGKHALSAAALDAEAEQMIASDPGLVAMKNSLFQRRAALTSQMANLTPNHPLYKQDTEELAQINKSLDSMIRDLRAKAAANLQQRLRADLQRTSEVEAKLNSQLGKMAGAAASATPKMQRANDLATDIVRLQNRFTLVDDQLHNLMLEDSVAGNSYIASPALPPLSPSKSGVFRNALAILFAGLFFALLAAVVRNKLDQKVYIAADIERTLGFAPMAVLPDFSQVSEGVAEEHLLRLSAGLEYARQQGNLRSCIFTGTAPGTGVTSVVSRVRSMLQTMGRATVLVDASGTPPPPAVGARNESKQLATEPGSRSTALLQQVTDHSKAEQESLVLTDTAPMSLSAETEYLARFVDAAIVVVESGKTTRAQLRGIAHRLQKLDVGAVGFVLNRVGLEKADPVFRHSVRAIEDHLRAQNRSVPKRTEQSRPRAPMPESKPVATESASRPQPVGSRQTPWVEVSHPGWSPNSGQTSQTASGPVRTEPPVQSSAGAPIRPEQPAQTEQPGPARGRDPQPAKFASSIPAGPDPKIERQPAPKLSETLSQMPWAESWKPFMSETADAAEAATAAAAHPAAQEEESIPVISSEPEIEPRSELSGEALETSYDAATRLGGLKSLIVSLGLQDQSKGDGEASQPTLIGAQIMPPRERSANVDESEQAVNKSAIASRLVTAAPEILPPKSAADADEERQKDRRDRRDPYDDVAILPSWRGQYRKK